VFDDFLYARISEDELLLEKGVTRQLSDLREFSRARDGRIVGEWSDNDVSAWKLAPRPGYADLMAAVAAPNSDHVQRRILVAHTSRLWRNRQERAHGIDTLGKLDMIVLPINGPELQLKTAAGRMVAGMLGEADTGESETKAERVFDAARERAMEGRANGDVLFGWKRIYEYDSRGRIIGFRDDEDFDQAEIVREIVRRLLAGESLLALTRDLNERGIPAPGTGHRRKRRAADQADDGSRWGKTSVKKMALRPANIALRVYHRGRPDEQLLPAAWPPIVDESDHLRVAALLTDPARTVERPGSRQHLLTWGIGECGAEGCGAHLRVAWKGNAKWGVKKLLYVCERKGCVGRNMEQVDRVAERTMVALLQRGDVADLLSGGDDQAAEMLRKADGIRARLQQAAAEFAEGNIEADQLRLITQKLKPQLVEAERQAKAHRPSPHLGLVLETRGAQAEQRWASLSVNQKRALMQAFGVRVVILPARRGPGFDPASVQVLPREP
jgi:site-specific DNA recombinase